MATRTIKEGQFKTTHRDKTKTKPKKGFTDKQREDMAISEIKGNKERERYRKHKNFLRNMSTGIIHSGDATGRGAKAKLIRLKAIEGQVVKKKKPQTAAFKRKMLKKKK